MALTCHFRHEGLKLGAPLAASRSSMKTCNVGKPVAAVLWLSSSAAAVAAGDR